MAATLDRVEFVWEADWDADTSYLEQEGFEDRLAAYRAGDYGYQGCYAVARLLLDGSMQTIRTPGLWGIESDSDAAYCREVEQEELAQLKEYLGQLGISLDTAPTSAL